MHFLKILHGYKVNNISKMQDKTSLKRNNKEHFPEIEQSTHLVLEHKLTLQICNYNVIA